LRIVDLPYPANPSFTGRDDDLMRIHEELHTAPLVAPTAPFGWECRSLRVHCEPSFSLIPAIADSDVELKLAQASSLILLTVPIS
jgi:hypothetical protein